MKIAAILVPFGLALGVAGGLMLYAGQKSPGYNGTKYEEKTFIVGEVRHPVSPEMMADAASRATTTSPYFKRKDIHDIDVQIGGAGKKPQFVYFILDGCPCSLDVQPLFNRMYQRFKDEVDFIGVINVGKEKGLDYAGQTTVLHPIVSDEKLEIVDAFKVKQSAYSVLILPDGTVKKMWPGYSEGSLKELNKELAKLTGAKEAPFDTAYAPKEATSGCFFKE